MPFEYVVYTDYGSRLQGTTEAPSPGAVEEMLWRNTYYIVSIKETAPRTDWRSQFPSIFGVKPGEVIAFSRQLATLVRSGVPLVPLLVLLRQQVTNETFSRALGEIVEQIESGSTISTAMGHFPLIFPVAYTRMMEVAERTGRLESVLEQASTLMEKQQAVAGRISGALLYPLFLLLMALGVVGVLMAVALPSLVGIFKEFHTDLPWTTRLLMGTADFFQAYYQILLFVIVAGLLGLFAHVQTAAGTEQLHAFLLRVPLIGSIIIKGNLATFTRSVAILLRAGLPLTEIMDMSIESVDNIQLRRSFRKVQTGLLQGYGFAYPLEQDPIFPRLMAQMVKVGEQAGALDIILETLAGIYEQETDKSINSLTAKIEPAMMMIVGGVVGFIAIAVITPMYSLIGAVK